MMKSDPAPQPIIDEAVRLLNDTLPEQGNFQFRTLAHFNLNILDRMLILQDDTSDDIALTLFITYQTQTIVRIQLEIDGDYPIIYPA